ncbi:MAG: NAD-dependent epimerase/dehydratase family protein, partial [Pseudomonadota bacterium]
MGMKDGAVLVVGGAGDIGSAICARLADAGHQVIVSSVLLSQAEEACANLSNGIRKIHPVE